MTPTLTAPDLVGSVIAGVSLSVSVSSKIPNPRPVKFATLREIGGAGRTDLVLYRATIMYFGWGSTEPDARAVAAEFRTALFGLAGSTVTGTQFYTCRDVGALNRYPDPESNQDRFAGTVELVVRET